MNARIILIVVLLTMVFLLSGAVAVSADTAHKGSPERIMNCGTCYNTYICPEAMNRGVPACNLKYYTFSGWSRIDGPNLILTNAAGLQKTVVLTANTLIYPSMLNLRKSQHVFVKYINEKGLSQAIRVDEGYQDR